MVAQFLVEGVELLARRRAHDAGDAQVLSLAAGAHLDRFRLEVRRMPENDLHDGLREARLLATHHLDGEVARKSERGAGLGHRQVERASRRWSRAPARITFCLNSW